MTIDLYTNFSEGQKLSKNLQFLREVESVDFLETTDVLAPVIVLSDISDILSSINYCYIPVLGKYYYMNPPTYRVADGIWAFPCNEDVGMTWRNDILAQDAIIARQEFNYDMQLSDSAIPTYQKTHIQYRLFPEKFTDFQIVIPILGNDV